MIGTGCYIIPHAKKKRRWVAQSICEEIGAHLIKIDNKDEDQAIYNELSKSFE